MSLINPTDPVTSCGVPEGTQAELRILETTDVHANLLSYDYHADQPVDAYGLTRVATLIRQARKECDNVLLFDNGDFLQGTPLSDLTARPGNGWTDEHPVMTAMNALGYDAAGLGNHEFNFGLPWLQEVLAQADFPFTCANAVSRLGSTPQEDTSFLPPYQLLNRHLKDQSGDIHPITIGVLGLVPPQVATWDQFHLSNQLWLRGFVETARWMVPRIRAAGANLVVVLAHTGIDTGPESPMMENAAVPLAAVPGIDALLAGHSHHVFPSPRFEETNSISPSAGTLHGTPTVMAGFRGSHLGVIDLLLRHEAGQWRVTGSSSQARPVLATQSSALPAEEDLELGQKLTTAHRATVRITQQPLGHSDAPLHSYLAMVGQSTAVQIVTRAQAAATRMLLRDQLDPEVPVLSASAPFKAGGRGGPRYFSDVPAGPLFLRHAADLYPFPNVLCVLQLNGAMLRNWLERATTVFNQIQAIPGEQALLNPELPAHAFDVIDGLTYRIDLSQPALFDTHGDARWDARNAGSSGRITALQYLGRPVQDNDRFIVATNNYRTFGGGPYKAAKAEQILFAGKVPIVDLIADYIRTASPLPAASGPTWQFEPLPGRQVAFETGPGLRRYSHDMAAWSLTDLGDDDAGFARFSMPL